MVISSLAFIYIFFPLFYISYLLFVRNAKLLYWVIIIFSIFFYYVGEKWLVIVMLLSGILDYNIARLIFSCVDLHKKRILLFLSVILNIALLCYFKYANLIIDLINETFAFFNIGITFTLLEITLPIGISFYTFQSMSYTFDAYYRRVEKASFVEYLTYYTMFPQLVAGPIVRFSEVSRDFRNNMFSKSNVEKGFDRLLIGIFQKVLLANLIAPYVDAIFSIDHNEIDTITAWVGVVCYGFQIYFDFSGYSNMAIGLGLMLGFHFPENFNFPYSSDSIQEFWRRWHMTLSRWFRDYVYIPLGGNRRGYIRTSINSLIVFSLCGVWHGAELTFIIWGLLHGFFISIEAILRKINLFYVPKLLKHIYTFTVVSIGWALFRSDNITQASAFIKNMLNFSISNASIYTIEFLTSAKFIILIIACIIFSLPSSQHINSKIIGSFRSIIFSLLFLYCSLLLLLDTYNPFIYFRF
ncbi:MAG: MBOAT family protein [Legionellales bacterium]|nr:MBOAT family protein [Legionellales bacterium]